MICAYCGSEIVEDAAFCPYCNTPVGDACECDDFEYEAFISYRHLPRDHEVASALQKGIEGFTIPKHLRAEGGPKRLGKLFRDEDELPTSSSLSDQIRDALKHARFLFVICTPHTNESQWVAREIELFASFHGRDKIRLVLAEAEPDDSFPTMLRTRLVKNSSGELVTVDEEPLAADFRDLSRKHVNTEKLRLIAPLIGCGFDDLRQRMKARRTKAAMGIASVITAVSVAFGSFATYQQFQIQENYRQMQINESEALAVEANTLFEQGDRMQAIQVALAALPESEAVQSRPYVPAAQLALENALEVYPTGEYWRSCYSLPYDELTKTVASENGYIVTTGDNRTLVVCDLATGVEVCTVNAEKDMGFAATTSTSVESAFFAGDALMCARGDALACFDVKTGEMRWIKHIDFFSGVDRVAVSESGAKLAFVTQPIGFEEGDPKGDQYLLWVLDAPTGAILEQKLLPAAGNAKDYRFTISNATCFVDENTVAVAGGKALFIVDLATGSCAVSDVAHGCADSLRLFGNQLYVVSKEKAGVDDQLFTIEAFDLTGKELWKFEREMDEMSGTTVSASGKIHLRRVDVCDFWQPGDVERPCVLVLFGSYILLLDAQDGSTFWSEYRTDLLVDCAVATNGEMTFVLACTSSGDIVWRRPEVSNITGTIYNKNIGEISMASFIRCGEETFLSDYLSNSGGRRVYRFASKIETEQLEPIEGFGKPKSIYWNRERVLLTRTDDGFTAYDPQTVELKFEVPFDSMPLPLSTLMPNAYCAPSGVIYLYNDLSDVQGGDVRGALAFNVYSDDDGSLVASYTVESESSSSWQREQFCEVMDKAGNVLGLAMIGTHEVRIVNHLTGETLYSWTREGHKAEAWIAGTKAILNEESTDEVDGEISGMATRPYKFSLVDLTSGETVACDLSNTYVGGSMSYGKSGACLSEDGTRFVAACADGGVRMFDATTGAVVWTSKEAPSQTAFLAISPISGDVLLQDDSGVCMLLSSKDGSILRTSSTTLPPIDETCGMIGDKEILVRWSIPGLTVNTGLAIVSLDEESFGPRCNVIGGFFLTLDRSTVLIVDRAMASYAKMHLYSLDELIELAQGVTAGHELTVAERHLYRID